MNYFEKLLDKLMLKDETHEHEYEYVRTTEVVPFGEYKARYTVLYRCSCGKEILRSSIEFI